MMNLLKPEYVFRPTQLWLRLKRGLIRTEPDSAWVHLPWGHRIEIDPKETIGRAIYLLGVYDLAVSESLWRLIEPGDSVVDAGANIGYMTSLMSARCGPRGRVFSFEPHPVILKKLKTHVTLWRTQTAAAIEVSEHALSDRSGVTKLHVPEYFSKNQGISYIGADEGAEGDMHEIRTLRLQDYFGGNPPSLMKVDVEGHELAVFKGADRWLADRRIRDIVFEDHGTYPTPAMSYLESHGYTLFRLSRSLRGPVLSDARANHKLPKWEPPNIIGTADPERALRLLRPRGWFCMGSRSQEPKF